MRQTFLQISLSKFENFDEEKEFEYYLNIKEIVHQKMAFISCLFWA